MDTTAEEVVRREAACHEVTAEQRLERWPSPDACATARMTAPSAGETRRARPGTACTASAREELASSST
eukprot:14134582-Heterocapsa_arctica.AAC.1